MAAEPFGVAPEPFALVCLLAPGPADGLRSPVATLRADPRGRTVPLLVIGDARRPPDLFDLDRSADGDAGAGRR